MDKFEVTNKQYLEFCTSTGNPFPEFWGSQQFKCSLDYPDHPVVGVSFMDAVKYAQWAGKRLAVLFKQLQIIRQSPNKKLQCKS